MTDKSTNSSTTIDPHRCQHIFENGTRCRLIPPSEDTFYCRRHAHLPQNLDREADITAYLPAGLENLDSAANINTVLTHTLILLAKGRISSRRAAVLAYLANQLLRTLPMIDRELSESSAPQPPAIDFDWYRNRTVQPVSDTTRAAVPDSFPAAEISATQA